METTKNIKQCPYCQCWFTSAKGGFKHHVQTCRPEDISSTNKFPSTNPLLSQHMVGRTENIEYDCDYVDEDINNDITQCGINNEHKLDIHMYNKSPKSSSSITKFQIGLSDIVNKHKASLQMYDEVCNLVNEYTSSPDFDLYAKLQKPKAEIIFKND